MLELVRLVALGVLAAPVVGAVIGSVWALRALGRPPRDARPDRDVALRLAAVLAALPLLGVTGYFVVLASGFGGSLATGLIFGLGLGAAIAAAVFCSGLLGYAVLAVPSRGSSALSGVAAGPLVLGLATAVGAQVFGMADAALYGDRYGPQARERELREAARLESLITVTILDVDATTFQAAHPETGANRTIVEGVRLTLRIHLAESMTLGSATKPARAWFYPNAAISSGWDLELPLEAPYALPAGDTTVSIGDRWPERGALVTWPDAPEPGPWTLHLTFRPASMLTDVDVDEVVVFEMPAA